MKRVLILAAMICCLLCTGAWAEVRICEAVSKNRTLHPDAQGAVHDYVILVNDGQEAVSLIGMTLCDAAGKAYPLPDDQLAPGGQLLIYCTGEAGGAPFKLAADGETLHLKAADGSILDTVEIPALGANERYVNGEIVVDRESSAAVSAVRLSEICASNAMMVDEGETPDWVEIENTGSEAVDLSGWYLSDNASKPAKWRLPEGFTLAGGESRVVWLHEETVGFKLSSEGEEVVLTDADGRIMDYVVYGAQPQDTSLALEDGLWKQTYSVTPGQANRILSKGEHEAEVYFANPTGVYISEVLTASANFPYKRDRYDYVELHNNTSRRISLKGWYLSDSASNPHKWAFPSDAYIPANGYAIIYCDGVEMTSEQANVYYATFKLSQDNDVVLLSKGSEVVDRLSLGEQYGGISCGRVAGGSGETVFFGSTTPKAANSKVNSQVQTEAPVLSHPGGLINETIAVSITAPEGAAIYYTLNGDTPTTRSSVYSGPIGIAKTTVLRAAAYKNGELMSPVVSASYLFGVTFDVPVVSLITDDLYLDDPNKGLFTHSEKKYDWEYPVHVQYFEEGELKINQLSSFKIVGGFSRKNGQKGMAVYARGALGEDMFSYNPFENRDYSELKSFTLRAAGTEARDTRFKDAFLTSLAEGANVMYQDALVAVVYINGQFWGHYNLREKINKYSIAQWEGVTDEEVIDGITILKNKGDVLQGSRVEMMQLIKFCRTADLNKEENLQYVLDNIDVMSWFDHTIYEIITGNGDTENVRYYKLPGGKWKVCLFDLDYAMSGTKAYPTDVFIKAPNQEETTVFHEPVSALLKVPAMQELFLTRFGEILYEKFQPDALDAQIDQWAAQIKPLIPAQHARWRTGDLQHWNEDVATLRKYCRERPARIVEHMAAKFRLSEEDVTKYFGDFLSAIQ